MCKTRLAEEEKKKSCKEKGGDKIARQSFQATPHSMQNVGKEKKKKIPGRGEKKGGGTRQGFPSDLYKERGKKKILGKGKGEGRARPLPPCGSQDRISGGRGGERKRERGRKRERWEFR